jgi:hypothetical protein
MPLVESKTGRYASVSISAGPSKITRSVHVLICEAFHGERPQNMPHTRHKDGDSFNNCPINLCWATIEENWNDKRLHGTATVGARHPASKFTEDERAAIRKRAESGEPKRAIARSLGVSQTSIQRIVKPYVRPSARLKLNK